MFRILTILSLLVLISACASNQKAPVRSAKYYFAEGEKLFQDGDYDDAIAMYEKARESYFSSDFAAKADLRIADAKYKREEYLEAAEAYDAFLKEHPSFNNRANILYRTGHAYFEEKLSIDRDPTYTQNALGAFEQFLAEYPEDPRATEAREAIDICKTRLAKHEHYIAKFYFKTKEYESAIARLIRMFKTFPDHSHNPESFYLLGIAQLRSGEMNDAAETLNYLEASFPDSKYTKKARKELSKK